MWSTYLGLVSTNTCLSSECSSLVQCLPCRPSSQNNSSSERDMHSQQCESIFELPLLSVRTLIILKKMHLMLTCADSLCSIHMAVKQGETALRQWGSLMACATSQSSRSVLCVCLRATAQCLMAEVWCHKIATRLGLNRSYPQGLKKVLCNNLIGHTTDAWQHNRRQHNDWLQ